MGGTVREVATTWLHHYVDETMVGTPDRVAKRMGEVIEEVGGDGYHERFRDNLLEF
ncbi:MAG: hypothetical protein JWN20_2408 [Jatrophihabitantaceae bacterium]|nr:hypothetical protein [Jatrophihabitantaceae bacterium]